MKIKIQELKRATRRIAPTIFCTFALLIFCAAAQAACPSNKQCTKTNCAYQANAYTGNIKGAVDNLVDGYGECLRDGDTVHVTTPAGESADYTLDADCTTPTNTCSDPDTITPVNNGGNMRWMLTKPRLDKADTDDLAEGATNKYFSGKTQDDLGDGVTYKQYNPAAMNATGGSLNGDIPITTTGAVEIQDNTGFYLLDNGGTTRVQFSPSDGYAIGGTSNQLSSGLEIYNNIINLAKFDSQYSPYINFYFPSNGANGSLGAFTAITGHNLGAKVLSVDATNEILSIEIGHPFSNFDKFRVNQAVAGLSTGTDYYVCGLKGAKNNLFTVQTDAACGGSNVNLTSYSPIALFMYSYKCASALCTSNDSFVGSLYTPLTYSSISQKYLGSLSFKTNTTNLGTPVWGTGASITAGLEAPIIATFVPSNLTLSATNSPSGGLTNGNTALSIRGGTNKSITLQDMLQVDAANGDINLLGSVEKIQNGTFTGNADYWELQRDNSAATSEWSYGTNQVSKVATAATTDKLYQYIPVQIGSNYRVSYDLIRSAGSINAKLGDDVGTTRSATGTYTETLTPTSAAVDAGLYFEPSSDFVGSIDNVSVRRLVEGGLAIDVNPNTTAGVDAGVEIKTESLTGDSLDTMPLLVQNTLSADGTQSPSAAKVARFRMVFNNDSGTTTFSNSVNNLANTIIFQNDGNYIFNSAGLKGTSVVFSAGNPTTGGTVTIPNYFAYHSTAADSSEKITFTGTDWTGFKADDFAAPTGGSSPVGDMTVTNVSGIKIDKQTAGQNNYGIILNGDGTGADIAFGTSNQLKVSRNAMSGNLDISGGGLTVQNMKMYTAFGQTLADDTDSTCDSGTDCIVLPVPTTVGYLTIEDAAGVTTSYTVLPTGVPSMKQSSFGVKTTTVIQNSNGWKSFAAGSGSITLVAAATGKWYELLAVDIFLDYGGTNAFSVGAGDDLVVDTNAAGNPAYSATIETTGFIDATADIGYHVPVNAYFSHGLDFTSLVNKNIRLSSTSGVNFGGNAAGDNLVRIETTYIEHQTTSGYLTGGAISSCGLPYTTGLCVYDAGSTANIINNTGSSGVYNIRMIYD